MNSNKELKIKDFYQSAILKTLGLELLRLEQSDEKHSWFVFNDPEDKTKIVLADYWNRDIMVNARDLVDSIRDLKTRLYQSR